MDKTIINAKIAELEKKLKDVLDVLLPEDYGEYLEYIEWLINKTNLFLKSRNFKKGEDYKKFGIFKRGDIVLVNFGYNVGTEKNKIRWAVVIDVNNLPTFGTLTVVPLTTKQGRTVNHPTCVFVGHIPPLPSNKTYVDIGNIRSVSKLRILRTVGKVNDEVLNAIDEKLKELFLGKC
ncbi:type II toxin-antitoxin system PemK/MazF family toxin [Anaerocellum danielii]|uniref:Type II toxin-antitoxin system PemK/MazF family toxin n=1 Tax=Anaerocellum danielii TaxID=1387557 RepID=A0ABZ0U0A8_9FIRM|nr:type II toxin-antitoxin system PemK/MazF family toxin [Caldicellulosiruptor danielii]WPX08133.1 type II toxin-antitoxin system PemK/MazF family toxin [Caldicellulosiruptor danielii]